MPTNVPIVNNYQFLSVQRVEIVSGCPVLLWAVDQDRISYVHDHQLHIRQSEQRAFLQSRNWDFFSSGSHAGPDESIDASGGAYARALVQVYGNSYFEDTADPNTASESASMQYQHNHGTEAEPDIVTQSATSSITASRSGISISASTSDYDVHGSAGAWSNLNADALDYFTFDIPVAYKNSWIHIPFSYCVNYETSGATNSGQAVFWAGGNGRQAYWSGDRIFTLRGGGLSYCGIGLMRG